MADAPALKRALGRWDLTAIGVNQVIGGAIFLLPSDVARLVGPWGPLAFLAVGLLSLSIALCFAEVGSRFDKTGGPYLPARAAFGRFVGFEVGWMLWFTRVTSQASVANGLALALAFYWPAVALGAPRMTLIAGVTIALTVINVIGIKQSSWVVNTLTIGKLAPLAIFIIVGIWFIDPSHFAAMPAVTREQVSSAAILLIFAYGGYEVTGVLAGEAANPRKDVPFAFVATLIVVTVVMSLTSLVATGVVPDLAASKTPLADGAAMFLGATRRPADFRSGAAISMTGNNMGQILNGSRTHFRAGGKRRLAALVRARAPALPHAVECHPVYGGRGADARAHRLVRGAGGRQRDCAAGDVSGGLRLDAGAAPARARGRRRPRAVHRGRRSRRARPRVIVALGILAGAIAGAAHGRRRGARRRRRAVLLRHAPQDVAAGL